MRVEDVAVVWAIRNLTAAPEFLKLDNPWTEGHDPYLVAAEVAKLLREKADAYQKFADEEQ